MLKYNSYYPEISVIVPVYNAENSVESCLFSLLQQNYPKDRVELIFINNSSTDRTSEILSNYKDKIKILTEDKKGPSAARNRGLINANGEVVVFTDADCVADKEWLYNIVQPLNDENIGIVGGKILSSNPHNKIEKFGERIFDHNWAINKDIIPYVITMNWASKLYVVRKAGLFNESLLGSEDCDLSRKIFKQGYNFVYQPDAIIYHNNEHTYSGLFNEGFLHGYWGVKINSLHKNLLKNFGYKRVYFDSYIEILRSLNNYIKNQDKDYSICYFIFNVGKKLGKFAGSIRFQYFDI